MSQENVEIIRRGFEAYRRGDRVAAFADFDAEIVFNPAEETSFQGLGAALSYVQRWEEPWDDYEAEAEELIDAGDQVLVTVHFRGRGKGSGMEVDARLYELYTLSNGKVIRMDEFTERSDALEAAGLRE